MTDSSVLFALNFKTLTETIVLGSSLFNLYLSFRSYAKTERQSELPEKLKSIATLNVSQAEFTKNREYNIDKKMYGLITSVLDLIILLICIHFDYFSFVWNSLFLKHGGVYRPAFYFIVIEQLRSLLVEIPSTYYYNFVVENKHGFNKMTIHTFFTDKIKTLFLGLIFQFFLFGILVYCMEKYQDKFILFAWIGAIGLTSVYLLLYPTFIAPMFNKFEAFNQENEKEKKVHDELIQLCSQLNFPLGKLYKIDGSKRSDHSQAYFFGFLGKKQIVVFDTLIEKASVEEIVAIVGHELGHWHHRHNIQMIIFAFAHIGLILYLFSFIFNNAQLYTDFGFIQKSYFMGLNMFFLLYSPIGVIVEAIMCFNVRRNEYQADQFAVKLGRGTHLLSGLTQLFRDNKADMDPDEIVALFRHTHPNLIDRTNAINQQMNKTK